MLELFSTVDADRSFNVIDSIIIDDAIRNGQADNGLQKTRAEILKVYNRVSEFDDLDLPVQFNPETGGFTNPNIPKYIEPTVSGYPGLEPPVG